MDDDKEVEMVLAHNENSNNSYNVASNLERNKEIEENILGQIDE